MTEQHTWRTVSSHHTSTGPIRYERCHCGAWRLASLVPGGSAVNGASAVDGAPAVNGASAGISAAGGGRTWITSSLETARVSTT
ncbi:hypothetical protein ACIA8K_10175 [Catenuloplanes sp. NPDC051500]|uniref:hypothetical protein n=1 Tax=Catenuloplanes sp. NPDC051500 TaxID=3363959 RepID=UPI0037BCE570